MLMPEGTLMLAQRPGFLAYLVGSGYEDTRADLREGILSGYFVVFLFVVDQFRAASTFFLWGPITWNSCRVTFAVGNREEAINMLKESLPTSGPRFRF